MITHFLHLLVIYTCGATFICAHHGWAVQLVIDPASLLVFWYFGSSTRELNLRIVTVKPACADTAAYPLLHHPKTAQVFPHSAASAELSKRCRS